MSDDFFADLLPMKPKVEDNSETLSGAKIPFDQDAALVSGLDNQEIHEVSEAPREHQRKHEVPDLLSGRDEEKTPKSPPMGPSSLQRSQAQVKEFQVVVEETMQRFASGLKTVLEGFDRRLGNVEALTEKLSQAAGDAKEVGGARESVEAERFAALAKGLRDVRGELQLLKDNQDLRAEVAELKRISRRGEEATPPAAIALPEPSSQETAVSVVSVVPLTPPLSVAPQLALEPLKAVPSLTPVPQASPLPSAPSAPSAPQAPTPPPAAEMQPQASQQTSTSHQAPPMFSQAQQRAPASLQPQYSAPLPPPSGPQYQGEQAQQQGLAQGYPSSQPQPSQPAQQYTHQPALHPQQPTPIPPPQGQGPYIMPSPNHAPQYSASPAVPVPHYSAPPSAKPFSAPPQSQAYSSYGSSPGNAQYSSAPSPYAGSYGAPTSNSGYPTLSQSQPALPIVPPQPRRYQASGPPSGQYPSGGNSSYSPQPPSRGASNYSSHNQQASRPPPPSGQSRDIPLEQVIDDVCHMGFSRQDVRSAVTELTEKGQAVDLNIVLDRLMNGPRR